MKTDAPTYLSPPQLARRWRVSTNKVYLFINSGELEAVDTSANRGRPRYRIAPEAVERFEQRRSTHATRRPVTARRKPATRPAVTYI